jgi:hypothetical protein
MDVLGFAALVVGGFTACAEFGSYAFVPGDADARPGRLTCSAR